MWVFVTGDDDDAKQLCDCVDCDANFCISECIEAGLSREAHQSGADTEASARACGATDGRGVDVQDGERGRGG